MIIVFGAAGFIGTYLVDQLMRNNIAVLAADINDSTPDYFSKRGIVFVPVDISKRNDFDKLPSEGVSAIVHLACVQPANVSEKRYDPVDYIRVNVIGILNILDYCLKASIPKIIYTSSHRNTQGLWKDGTSIREEEGRSIKYTGEYAMYSISESAAADCLEYYSRQFGIQGLVFRLPPVYGYGPHTEIFKNGKPIKTGFKIFLDNAIAARPIEVWGDCNKGRDIIYVKDVVSAIILASRNEVPSGLYNISSGQPLSLKEEAQAIARVFSPNDRPSELIYLPEKQNSIEPFVYDNTKAKTDLDWSPQYSFEEMLIDYENEMKSGRFNFLLEKRRQMLVQE